MKTTLLSFLICCSAFAAAPDPLQPVKLQLETKAKQAAWFASLGPKGSAWEQIWTARRVAFLEALLALELATEGTPGPVKPPVNPIIYK